MVTTLGYTSSCPLIMAALLVAVAAVSMTVLCSVFVQSLAQRHSFL